LIVLTSISLIVPAGVMELVCEPVAAESSRMEVVVVEFLPLCVAKTSSEPKLHASLPVDEPGNEVSGQTVRRIAQERLVTNDPRAGVKSAARTTPTVDSSHTQRTACEAADKDGYAASRQLYR
jgi:hypothetical protein